MVQQQAIQKNIEQSKNSSEKSFLSSKNRSKKKFKKTTDLNQIKEESIVPTNNNSDLKILDH